MKILLVVFASTTRAFVPHPGRRDRVTLRRAAADTAAVETFIHEKYPSFDEIAKLTKAFEMARQKSDDKMTVFAPNEGAFTEKKRQQLLDPRNLEAAEKMAAYHFVGEPVTLEQLQNSGGLITLGGRLDLGQTTSGGLFGLGATEDGGVKVNQANIVNSFEVDGNVVHEVDKFVSPEILWRYVDQLRIPGSS